METSPNSHMLGATSIPKDGPVTLRSTQRSLWSPKQVTYDNCPEGMSVQHPTPAQLHGQLLHPPSLLQGKQAARWLAGTPSVLKCSEVSALQSLHIPAVSQCFISPVIPSLKQSVINMKGAGQEKKGQGKKRFSTQSGNFLKEESDLWGSPVQQHPPREGGEGWEVCQLVASCPLHLRVPCYKKRQGLD